MPIAESAESELAATTLSLPDGGLRVWRSRPGDHTGAAPRPKLHFAHATGFHARTYAPLFAVLAPHFEIIAWDMRGHGESRALGDPRRFPGWEAYYRDLTALIDAEGPLFLAGHSVGGVVSLVAAGRRPASVRGVLLLDPVLLEPPVRLALACLQALGLSDRFHLARLAARRRCSFASREAMFEAYRGRGPFRSWPDRWLRAYVDHGVVDGEDGRVTLACAPAFESRSFATTEAWPWRRVGPVPGPLALLAGEVRSTCGPSSRRTLARRYPHGRIDVLPDTTHFLPMERPEVVVAAARGLLERERAAGPGAIVGR